MLKQVLKPAAYGMELDMAPAELVASLPETALVMSGYGIILWLQLSDRENGMEVPPASIIACV